MHTRFSSLPIVALLTLGAAILAGCSRPILSSGVRVRSVDHPVVFAPAIASSGYRSENPSSADIYFSDIPLGQLAAADSLEGLSGSIVHMHMFLRPKPGKTPVERTASTVTIRHIVLADGEIGLYGGGGFLFPSGKPGDDSFGGSVKEGSVRLLASTPGFVDRLGAAEFSAGLVAPEDEAASAIMAHLVEHAARVARGRVSAAGG